ncbi:MULTISPECIES: VanZ family protein [unclassified Nonlabens]|uniref:VanZ family protein n=1 Tax=unclassified Nonlabens TaxID=2615035 RepID=UPI000A3DECD3|nr:MULTISPECIES: VanZ family protein [unclassified Nonlabens]
MKHLLKGVAPVYTLVIAYLSLTSLPFPIPFELSFQDKVYHAIAYSIMAIVWYFFFYVGYVSKFPDYSWNIKNILEDFSRTVVIGATVLSFIIGVLIELGQGYFSQNRSMDIFDVFANVFGIIIGALLLYVISKMLQIKKS